MGNKSNIKGAEGEREVCRLLEKHGFQAQRGPRFIGPDIVHNIDGLHIEVKRVESLDIYKALSQSKRDAAKLKLLATVFTRQDEQDWVVILDAEMFVEMLKLIRGLVNDIQSTDGCDGS